MTSTSPKGADFAPVPLGAVLLGGALPGVDSSALRQRQLDQNDKTKTAQRVSLTMAVLLVATANAGQAPWWAIASYLALFGAVFILRNMLCASRREAWIDGGKRTITREVLLGAVTALTLCAPLPWLAWTGDLAALSQTTLILLGLIAVYGVASSSIPMLYCAIAPWFGLLAVGSLLYLGAAEQAAGVFMFTIASIGVTLGYGRIFIRVALVNAAAAENGETVSLLLREFEDTGADWLWQIDSNRRITRPSPRFAHAIGRDADELEGMSFLQLLAGEQWQSGKFPTALHELANLLNRKESFASLIVPVTFNDRLRWWELSASPTYDASNSFMGFRGVGSDVTEQRASADRIAHLARFDALTGLPNRLHINETLAGALEQAATWRRRCAFIMIDLDRFKAVNDTLGHPIGDRLLAQVAARLKQICNDNVIAGRLGGDEFGVILREIEDVEMIERIGKRIVDVVSRPYEIDQHTLYVGASLGYAIGPRDGATVEALTRNADLALYRSKDRGGGLVNSYEPTLHDQARERREIEIELRSALARDEMQVHYQPVVFADGSVDGFEALLRWNSKKLGSISPVKFIPIAEDTRLIGPIGEWVLQTACREAVRWPSSTKVAVNVSAEQLSSPGFVASVVKALSHSGLPPHRLELEVTESVFLREVSGAMATLDQVRSLGVRLSLDDFGTGYSSLGYLRMGQFSTIKVDRSFVQGALAGARESIAIIRAVVALADSLEMSTTAEGVETQDEANAIVDLGCKKLQGYHFGRPMCAEDARAIFAADHGAPARVA